MCSLAPGGFGASRRTEMTGKGSTHTQKIFLADFHAIVTQNAVRCRGVEIKIGEGKIIEKLLSLQRHGVRADGKSDILGVAALELCGLEGFQIVDGFGEP